MAFNIDFCDFSISGNLEKLSFNVSVIDFKYSKYLFSHYTPHKLCLWGKWEGAGVY